MMEALLNSRVAVYEKHPEQVALVDPARAQEVFSMLIYPIYELLIEPMHDVIDQTIINNLDTRAAKSYTILAVLLVLAVVFQIGALIQINEMDSHMRRVLKLLLHCPAGVIMHTPRVMAVLSGDFRSKRWDEGVHKPAFFKQVVTNLPEAVFTLDSERVIRSMNTAADRLFGSDILNQPIALFLREPRFSGYLARLIAVPVDGTAITEQLNFQKSPTVVMHFETTAQAIQDAFVVTFRDTTTSTRYHTLVTAERAKSDQLLRSILPPNLVERVASGERNISFSVPSVAVVFMDIVGFTPWCSSSTAEKVMAVLNGLFKMFDHHCLKHSTMTRIKCIGDCYMAAGGVFSEVSQPIEHTTQVVTFGLECLESLDDLNEEFNETLQIRVGISTGGPIIAGILGAEGAKPTFEILGPTINVAQQMEHNGVPGQVHISRPVYELIYGEHFIVKERTAIEIKGEEIQTYLVIGRSTAME
jgi:class 3 adenylate cyclase